MGDHLQAGKPSWYVTNHPGQLSLAIPSWVGAMSTRESWHVNRHTMRCTSPISVVLQCKLVSGLGLKKRCSMGLTAQEGLYVFTFYVTCMKNRSDTGRGGSNEAFCSRRSRPAASQPTLQNAFQQIHSSVPSALWPTVSGGIIRLH